MNQLQYRCTAMIKLHERLNELPQSSPHSYPWRLWEKCSNIKVCENHSYKNTSAHSFTVRVGAEEQKPGQNSKNCWQQKPSSNLYTETHQLLTEEASLYWETSCMPSCFNSRHTAVPRITSKISLKTREGDDSNENPFFFPFADKMQNLSLGMHFNKQITTVKTWHVAVKLLSL